MYTRGLGMGRVRNWQIDRVIVYWDDATITQDAIADALRSMQSMSDMPWYSRDFTEYHVNLLRQRFPSLQFEYLSEPTPEVSYTPEDIERIRTTPVIVPPYVPPPIEAPVPPSNVANGGGGVESGLPSTPGPDIVIDYYEPPVPPVITEGPSEGIGTMELIFVGLLALSILRK